MRLHWYRVAIDSPAQPASGLRKKREKARYRPQPTAQQKTLYKGKRSRVLLLDISAIQYCSLPERAGSSIEEEASTIDTHHQSLACLSKTGVRDRRHNGRILQETVVEGGCRLSDLSCKFQRLERRWARRHPRNPQQDRLSERFGCRHSLGIPNVGVPAEPRPVSSGSDSC